MFAGIDDHEIFDAPHGQDNDLTEEEEEGLVTEVITDVELSHLDSHQRSIMISEIMERTSRTINKFDEESRDEMADLKSLENQMNREEITKMIKNRSVVQKKLQNFTKKHVLVILKLGITIGTKRKHTSWMSRSSCQSKLITASAK